MQVPKHKQIAMGLFVEVVLCTAVIAVPQARLPLLAASVGTQVFKALGTVFYCAGIAIFVANMFA